MENYILVVDYDRSHFEAAHNDWLNVAVRFKHTDDMRHVWEFIEVNTEERKKAG